jgi:hypothetical protein
VRETEKRLHCGSRAGHQQQGQCHLSGDQEPMRVTVARASRDLRAVCLDQLANGWV